MENNEMIEKLREKADLSYEEAYNVLKSVNWNFLDAVAALEKEGIIKEKSAVIYSTKRDDTSDDRNFKKDEEVSTPEKIWKFIVGILDKAIKNNLHVLKNGKELVCVPILILLIFLCVASPAVIILILGAFFCGCSFSFSGPDLGKDKYNKVLEKIKIQSDDDKKD